MSDLAYNLLWSWDHSIRSLFRRLDPVLWKNSGHNPVLMLGRVPQATLERAAADPRFLAAYRRACERYDTYLERSEPAGRPADRVFLDGVRPGRMHADLLRRPGRALGRSFEGFERRAAFRWSASVCCIKKATCSSRSIRMAGSRSAIRSTISIRCRCARFRTNRART